MTKVLPRSTWSTLATRRLKMSANQLACSGVMLMVLPFGPSSMGVLRSPCLSLSRRAQPLVVTDILVYRTSTELHARFHAHHGLVGTGVRRRSHGRFGVRGEGPFRVVAADSGTVRVQKRDGRAAAVGRLSGGGQEADIAAEDRKSTRL